MQKNWMETNLKNNNKFRPGNYKVLYENLSLEYNKMTLIPGPHNSNVLKCRQSSWHLNINAQCVPNSYNREDILFLA